jgi:tetraacyldisaccharide 4'-kinase
VFEASIEPDPAMAAGLRGQRVFAFAGIGDPARFHATLRTLGAQVAGTRDFADHHVFSVEELASLRKEAAALDARLVTTQKDLMRITDPTGIEALPVRLAFAEPLAFADYMAGRIGL